MQHFRVKGRIVYFEDDDLDTTTIWKLKDGKLWAYTEADWRITNNG